MNNNDNISNASRGSASSTNTNSTSRRNRPPIRRQENRTRIVQQNVERLPVFESLNQEQRNQLTLNLNEVNVYELQRNNSESSLSTGSRISHNLEPIQEETEEQRQNRFNDNFSMMSISDISSFSQNNHVHHEQVSVDNPQDEFLRTRRIIHNDRLAAQMPLDNLSISSVIFDEHSTQDNEQNR